MKIQVKVENLTFSSEWPEDNRGFKNPDVETAVDQALYLLSLCYPPKEVEEAAHDWIH